MINIYPDKIHYFKKKLGRHFILIITEGLKESIHLFHSKKYLNVTQLICGQSENVNDLILAQLPKNADVLFFPFQYMQSAPILEPSSIDRTQRICMFDCTPTTPITVNMISHFMAHIYSTKPEAFAKIAEPFYQKIERASYIYYRNPIYNTCATLTINDDCLWSDFWNQIFLGEIGVLPAGEIALTHYLFRDPAIPTVELNGEIVLHGLPILHGYKYHLPESAMKRDYLYKLLKHLQQVPLKCTVRSGIITSLQTLGNKGSQAKIAFEELFSQDSRYRHIFEIGVGLDPRLQLFNENCTMNETYGGSTGCVHFGVGTKAALEYHLDVLCPDTLIETDAGDVLVDIQKTPLKRVRKGMCPCDVANVNPPRLKKD